MTLLLGFAAIATLSASLCSLENNAVMALPLAIVFAGLVRTWFAVHPQRHHRCRTRAADA